jgi:SulP family sulfate permease
LLATFVLTVLDDLTTGIVVGVALGSLLFISRMAKATQLIERPLVEEDKPDSPVGRSQYDPRAAAASDIVIYRISGAFFFGAAATVGAVLDRSAEQGKTLILDCSALPFLDSTAARVLDGAAERALRKGVKLIIAGASAHDRHMLFASGLKPPRVHYAASTEDALALLRNGAA